MTLRADLDRTRRSLEGDRQRKSELLTSLVEKKETHAAYLQELEEAEAKLGQLLSGLSAADVSVPITVFKGALPWPAAGRVRTTFGRHKHPRFETYTFHNGIEVQAPADAPVAAVHDGTVAFADQFLGYGLLVILDHGGKNHTLYAHLAEARVKTGDHVAAGAVVGTVGASGVDGPGVYFEVRSQGKPQDPLEWLTREGARARRRVRPLRTLAAAHEDGGAAATSTPHRASRSVSTPGSDRSPRIHILGAGQTFTSVGEKSTLSRSARSGSLARSQTMRRTSPSRTPVSTRLRLACALSDDGQGSVTYSASSILAPWRARASRASAVLPRRSPAFQGGGPGPSGGPDDRMHLPHHVLQVERLAEDLDVLRLFHGRLAREQELGRALDEALARGPAAGARCPSGRAARSGRREARTSRRPGSPARPPPTGPRPPGSPGPGAPRPGRRHGPRPRPPRGSGRSRPT